MNSNCQLGYLLLIAWTLIFINIYTDKCLPHHNQINPSCPQHNTVVLNKTTSKYECCFLTKSGEKTCKDAELTTMLIVDSSINIIRIACVLLTCVWIALIAIAPSLKKAKDPAYSYSSAAQVAPAYGFATISVISGIILLPLSYYVLIQPNLC